jgi:subtilisin-like proprotein convertase family protein
MSLMLGAMLASGVALAGTPGFCNNAAITLNDAANGSPYPSAITVVGGPGSITGVTVTLNGVSHTYPDDLGIALVGPTGAALLLQSGAGDENSALNNVSYSFADAAAAQLPDLTGWAGGSYKPTSHYGAGDSFPAPGPGLTYGNPGPGGGGTATLASVYNGTTSNGTWNLYAVDFANGDAGQIAGGWCIAFTGTPVSLQQFSVE